MDPVNTRAKFEVCSYTVPEIIGGTQKNSAVPVYSHPSFSAKF